MSTRKNPSLGARLAVVVCSVGRPECVESMARMLASQSRLPDVVVFSVTSADDVDCDPRSQFPKSVDVTVIVSRKGLPHQRNAALDKINSNCDIVAFFDDDYVPSHYALAGIEFAFGLWPNVAGMTGLLLADGIHVSGFDEAQAMSMVQEWDVKTQLPPERQPKILTDQMEGLYGCNMVYRMSAIGSLRFDERLPLYAWQEDIDFASRTPGDRVATDAFAGVHRGVKGGRERAGYRLGYSQIVNPWYLVRKGTMSGRFALRLASRNFAANHLKSLKPEPWVDRFGRMRGNWRGIFDILTGKADPERILTM